MTSKKEKQQQIKDFIKDYRRYPSERSANGYEKTLRRHFSNYTSPSSSSYDILFIQEIHNWAESLGVERSHNKAKHKQKIKEFIKENKKRPYNGAKNPAERRLGRLFNSYTHHKHNSYDPKFKKEVEKLMRSLGVAKDGRCKKIQCCNNGVIYPSIQAAAKDLELNPSAITMAAKGQIKATGGYTFKYFDEDADK